TPKPAGPAPAPCAAPAHTLPPRNSSPTSVIPTESPAARPSPTPNGGTMPLPTETVTLEELRAAAIDAENRARAPVPEAIRILRDTREKIRTIDADWRYNTEQRRQGRLEYTEKARSEIQALELERHLAGPAIDRYRRAALQAPTPGDVGAQLARSRAF